MFIAEHMNVECMLYSVPLIKCTQLECLLIVFFFYTIHSSLYLLIYTVCLWYCYKYCSVDILN